jgi:ribosomal protein L11 methyltransferase
MNYAELRILFKQEIDTEIAADALITELAEIGFESFSENTYGLDAFIPETELKKDLLPHGLLDDFCESWEIKTIEGQNWNSVWEENYDPVCIDDQVYVKAHFHPEKPHVKYTLNITPKMSFGTGHHATTELMMRHMLETNFENKNVLDLGTGTGILAILALKCGAAHVTATEIEDFALENASENFALNGMSDYTLLDARTDEGPYGAFPIVLANITRNTLVHLLPLIRESCLPNGTLLISGFFTDDVDFLTGEFKKEGFGQPVILEKNNWASIKFRKS